MLLRKEEIKVTNATRSFHKYIFTINSKDVNSIDLANKIAGFQKFSKPWGEWFDAVSYIVKTLKLRSLYSFIFHSENNSIEFNHNELLSYSL